jgi:hypothetical protein
MGGAGRRTCNPELILAGHRPRVVALADSVRRLIHGMIDGVSEAGYPGLKVIGFRRVGAFAFLQPMADHVRLGFEHGHALPDFTGRLEGDGERVRHIAIRALSEVSSREVKMLLSAALFDDETHGFRDRARPPRG